MSKTPKLVRAAREINNSMSPASEDSTAIVKFTRIGQPELHVRSGDSIPPLTVDNLVRDGFNIGAVEDSEIVIY